jgi:hypothetical protein
MRRFLTDWISPIIVLAVLWLFWVCGAAIVDSNPAAALAHAEASR